MVIWKEIRGRPLVGAAVVGSLTAALVYVVGGWAVSAHKTVEYQKLTITAHQIVQTQLLRKSKGETALKDLLQKAVQDPHVASAAYINPDNSILAIAAKDRLAPTSQTEAWSLPVVDAQGRWLGKVEFQISNNLRPGQVMRLKAAAAAVAGFLITGIIFLWASRSQRATMPLSLANALKDISLGRLDVEIETPAEPEFKAVATSLTQMVEGLRERDRMKHSIGRIMDPKLAEALIKEDPKLGARTRKATILFCDIRNYTSLCEELNSDELQDFLNEYWKGTVEIIMEQEGTIDKFHGDGVCVIFGAPALHEDDPLRAVRTAWRLVGNVASINERRRAKRKQPIQIGIGIHTGEVIAGHIGSERRMDYTVVGDVVNIAARIEELNKKYGTQILISDHVYEKVEASVRVKTLTLAHLRGHKRPILVHVLKEFHDQAIIQDQDDRKAA